MTCRSQCQPEPAPARHVITFTRDVPVGFGACSRCHRLIAVEAWAGNDPCPSPTRTEEE